MIGIGLIELFIMYHISSAVHCIYMKWVQFQIFSVFRHAMSVPPSFALSLLSAIFIPIQLSVFDCVITLSMTVMSAVSWRGIRVHPSLQQSHDTGVVNSLDWPSSSLAAQSP